MRTLTITLVLCGLLALVGRGVHADERLRFIIETDAGGDPDDEQSLVRFLLYANEWDVEGIIANRPVARDGENLNTERTGLGIVRQLLDAYGECHAEPRQARRALSRRRRSSGGARWPATTTPTTRCNLIIAAVDRDDPRPVWYSDWGTDNGAATNNLKRALDRVLANAARGATPNSRSSCG